MKQRGPMSTLAILSLALGQTRVGARQRANFERDVELALQKLHANAVVMYGEEHAACVLAHILAKAAPARMFGGEGKRGRTPGDAAYVPRPWAVKILKQHRVAIEQTFAREARAQAQEIGK